MGSIPLRQSGSFLSVLVYQMPSPLQPSCSLSPDSVCSLSPLLKSVCLHSVCVLHSPICEGFDSQFPRPVFSSWSCFVVVCALIFYRKLCCF